LTKTANRFSYKTLGIITVFLLIGIVALFKISSAPKLKINAAWWDESWSFRRVVNIANSSGSDLANYQTAINLDTASLISANKMKSDCSDIRITDISGQLVKYWFTGCNTNNTQIWSRLPSIPSSGTAIHIYYGNPSAVSAKTNIGDSDFPGLSCKSIVESGNSIGNGNYWIDPTNGDFSDKFQAYCDMTNDAGGWMLATQSMINSEVGSSVTTTKTNNSLGGVNIQNIIASPAGCGPSATYSVLFKDIIPWTQIKADYEFTGGNSCWGIFGNNNYGTGSNITPFVLGTDTIRNQVKMGGSNGNAFDGINNRCDNETINFWHSNQGVGTTRSAQVILRRNSMESLAGLGTGAGCTAAGYGWKYQNIYLKETSMVPSTLTATVSATEEQSPAPIAYWKFDEGNGSISHNSSSSSLNGTITNPNWQSEDNCISGKCLYFDGSGSSYVTINNNPSIQITGSETVSMWVKPLDFNTRRNPINKAYGGEFTFTQETNGGVNYYWGTCGGDCSPYQGFTSNPLILNQWNLITLTRDLSSGQLTWYINGKQTNQTGTSYAQATASTANIIIGRGYAGNYYGYIDDVKIYSYARTPSQIKNEYNSGISRSSTYESSVNLGSNSTNNSLSNNLVAYWKADESSGNVTDFSGNNNTATVNGANNFSSGKFGNGFRSGVGTTNLFPNPSAETNLSDWGSWQGTNSMVNTTALFGSYSVLSVQTTAATYTVFDFDNTVPNYIPVQGQTITCSVYVKTSSAWNGKPGTIVLRENGGTQVSNSATSSFTYTTNWQRVSVTKTIAQADRTSIDCYNAMSGLGVNDGAFFYSDGLQVEIGSSATPYIDGSLGTGYNWTGTAHASVSVRTASTATVTSIPTDTSGSVSFWFNAPALDSSKQCPLGSGSGDSSGGLFFALQNSGITATHVYGAGVSTAALANASISDNSWNHVVYSWDNSSRKGVLFLNGQKQQTVNYSQAITIGEYLQNLGSCTKTGYSPFNGTMDDIRVYNRALSDSEISQLYNWAPGPIAYWDLNENSGSTINDKSGNNLIGTFGTGNSAPSWSIGKFGGAVDFSPTTKFIKVPLGSLVNNFNTNIYGRSFSYSLWFKSNDVNSGTNQYLLANNAPCNNPGSFSIFLSGGKIYYAYYSPANAGQATHSFTPSITLQNNQWYHLEWTKTYGQLGVKAYLNGISQTISGDSTFIGNSISNIVIGAYNGDSSTCTTGVDNTPQIASRSINGLLDDIKIYNYIRSPKQVVEDMNSSASVSSSSNTLVGYWKMDEGSGTILKDSSNKQNNCTLNSNSMWSNDGQFNKSLYFNGSTYADCGNNSSFDFGTSSFTVSMWYKFPIGATNPYWSFGKGNGYSGAGFGIAHWTTTDPVSIGFYVNDGTNTTSSAFSNYGCSLTRGTWGYCAWTIDRENKVMKSYQNGKYTGQTNISTLGNISNNSSLLIGSMTGNNYNGGNMDEVKIYSGALTVDEVKIDYNRNSALQLGSLSANTGSTAPSNSASQEYCLPGDSSVCTSPVAEWKFEEGSGTSVFDSGSGTYTGSFSGTPTREVGKYGKSINSSASNYITVPTVPTLTAPYTVSFWFNPQSIGAVQTILSLAGVNGYPVFNLHGNRLLAYAGGEKYRYGAKTFIASDANKWWFATFVIADPNNLNTWKVYLNGQDDSSTTGANTGVYFDPSSPGAISSSFTGKIDNVRIYNYARTPAQIAWEYNQGQPVAWWKLDECNGTIAHDSSGNSNNGTIVIGASGTQTSPGTCTDGSTASAWNNGKTGRLNSSLNLDGNDDYITIPHSANLMPQSITVAGWIKFNSNASWMIIDKADGGTSGSYYIYGDSLSNGTWSIFGPTGARYNCGLGSFNTNTWYHLAGTFDAASGQMRCYVNGLLKGTVNSAALGSNTSNVYLGRYTGGYQSNAQIDDIRVYNYSLNPYLIKSLFNNGAITFN
jgi:hypothetical protein